MNVSKRNVNERAVTSASARKPLTVGRRVGRRSNLRRAYPSANRMLARMSSCLSQ